MALQRAYADAGVACTLQLVPGHHHAEGYTAQAISGSLEFLRRVLRRHPRAEPTRGERDGGGPPAAERRSEARPAWTTEV